MTKRVCRGRTHAPLGTHSTRQNSRNQCPTHAFVPVALRSAPQLASSQAKPFGGADDEHQYALHPPRLCVLSAGSVHMSVRPSALRCRPYLSSSAYESFVCFCCAIYQAAAYAQMTPSWWPRHFLSATSFALLLGFWFGSALQLSPSNKRPVGIDRGEDRISDHDDLHMPTVFKKDFTRPLDIPKEGLEAAMEVLRSGRLFRYSAETAELSQVQKIG